MTRTATFVALVLVSSLSFSAQAWNRLQATRFATLPPGTAHPEGIAIDSAGNVYVADFDVNRAAGPGQVVVFSVWSTWRARAISCSVSTSTDSARGHPTWSCS